MADELLERLRAAGVDAGTLREVEAGVLRQADYTRKTQEVAAMREQMAYTLGQQAAGGASASTPKSRVEQFFETLPDSEETRGAREFFMGALSAFREDMQSEQSEQIKPLLSYVNANAQAEALDQRLATELKPYFGSGIEAYWPQLREQMQAALSAKQVVDPIGFVFRSMPEKAQELMLAHRETQQEQQAASTGEGFAVIARQVPSMTAPSGNLRNGNGNGVTHGAPNGAPSKPVIPSMADLAREFMSITAEVNSGAAVRG